MAMKERQHMVRTPWSWWLVFVDHGKKNGKQGAEVAREAMQKGSEVMGLELPNDQTLTKSERKARKVEKLKAELAALE